MRSTFDVERTSGPRSSGAVMITSGDRVSEADRLELDEAAGVALLTGRRRSAAAGPTRSAATRCATTSRPTTSW